MIKIYLVEGGEGSGNFNHKGRPGEVGGSSSYPAVANSTTRKKFAKQMEDEYRNNPEFRNMADGGILVYSRFF